MAKKKKNIDHDIAKTVKRQQMKDAGALDGRFNTKVEKAKKGGSYSRKKKHKNQGDE
jgi:stalled ribosome alternative rescue factor ArfA